MVIASWHRCIVVLALLVFFSICTEAYGKKGWTGKPDYNGKAHNFLNPKAPVSVYREKKPAYNGKAHRLLQGEITTKKKKKVSTKRKKYRKNKHKKKTGNREKLSSRETQTESSNEKKIQHSLTLLGFYSGPIDGNINENMTRRSISAMNKKYYGKYTSFLDTRTKEALVRLADLIVYNKYLVSKKRDKRSANTKIQTALRVHKLYSGRLDGIINSETRNSIAKYKKLKNLSGRKSLDFEEKYQLIMEATMRNEKSIKRIRRRLESGMQQLDKVSSSKPAVTEQVDAVLGTKTDNDIAPLKVSEQYNRNSPYIAFKNRNYLAP